MAIQKNAKKAAPEAPVAEEKKAPAKTVAPKAAPKATPKATAKPAPEPVAEVEVESKAEKVGRKEIAALIREKVAATGAAISPKVAEIAVVAYEEAIQSILADGKQVALPGFGTFMSVARTESIRPNPQKPGEKITVKAHNAPKFKPGAKLKAAVNGGVETDEAE